MSLKHNIFEYEKKDVEVWARYGREGGFLPETQKAFAIKSENIIIQIWI